MNAPTQESRHYGGFLIGMVTGTFAGAGLLMWLAPRTASELGQRMTDSARSLGKRASEQYQQVSTRVGKAVDELTRNGHGVLDDVADTVARGVRRHATTGRTDRAGGARKHSAADAPRSL
jgi:gas vesicle protein